MNELQALLDAIKSLTDIDDDELTDDVMKTMLDQVDQQFMPALVEQSVNQIIKNLEDQGLNRQEAQEAITALIETIKEMVYGEITYTGNKKILVDTILNRMFNIFDTAAEKYHSYAIELPIKLEEGAQMPTYAHDSDAAADLYAYEDTQVAPNTYGNKIRTGVSIQLPEGWVAMIFPRSSIGAKTPLRLSNSAGIIDSGYRGELGVLYDNTSINPMEIKKGDRIAQLLVMPSYRFKGIQVDELKESDRGEGGFGSTGA